MNALDLAQPRYAHLAKPAFAENELREHLIEHHAMHRALPSVRALRETFGGGNSRLTRIRQGVEVELGLRAVERSPRRMLGRLETVTSRLADLGATWSPAADAPFNALSQKVEALNERLERREAQLAQALAALHALVERFEPAMGRRFRTFDDFTAEQRSLGAAPAPETHSATIVADRLDQAVARAENALADRATAEPPPAWVRSAAASATAALDGRLQSIEETLRDSAVMAQNELRAVAEATQQIVAQGITELATTRSTLSTLAETHRQGLEKSRPMAAALDALLGRAQQRALLEDRRASALSEALIALAESQSAQVDVFMAGMVALESQVIEHATPRRQPRQRSRPPSRQSRAPRR